METEIEMAEHRTLRHGDIKPIHVLSRGDRESWQQVVVFSRKVIEVQCGVKAPKVPVRFDADRPDDFYSGMHMTFPDWDAMSDDVKARIYAVCDAACEASGMYARESGPGRPFASAPSARIYTRFVVVRQSGGLDI